MKIVKIIDLSRSINTNTQVYPGDPVPEIRQVATIEVEGFNLAEIRMGSQSGTHIDAPFHFDDKTMPLDELSLGLFFGHAVVLNCGQLGGGEMVSHSHVSSQIEAILPGDMAIFRTGWSKHYQTPRYFENPCIDPELIKTLLNKGVLTFGIDAINIDPTPSNNKSSAFLVHHLIAEAGGVICENLCNLEQIDFDPIISIFPLKFEKLDGAPVRAVALHLET
jgi:kynurenine formamidase